MARPEPGSDGSPDGPPGPPALARPASPAELFVSFTLLAIQGFGGVLAFAQQMLCERRRWLDPAQFVEVLAIGQVLPGPNICNVAVIVGHRFFGVRGALAALGGLVAAPLVLVVGIALLYEHLRDIPAVAGAARGMGAVAAGLVIGTAARLAGSLRRNPLGALTCGLLAAVMFGAIALVRLPLLWALPGVGLPAVALAWRAIRRAGSADANGTGAGP